MFFSKTITIVIIDKNGKFQIFIWFLTVSYHSTRAAIKRVQNKQIKMSHEMAHGMKHVNKCARLFSKQTDLFP